MDRRAALFAVVAVVAVAGCSAFAPGGGTVTPAETVTPAPVPTAGGDAAPTATLTDRPDLAQFTGISARRGLDVEAVLSAHVEALSTRSYTVEWRRQTVNGSGPVAREFRRRVAVADDETYLRRAEGGREGVVTTTYVSADGAYERVAGDGNPNVAPVTVRGTDPATRQFARLVAFEMGAFFGAGYEALDVVERDGRAYARLFTTRAPPQLGEIYDAYALRNFTATAWVAPEGYVQAVQYEFDLVGSEDSLTVRWRYAYTDVGATSVDRPPWVDEAANGTEPGDGTGTATVSPTATTDPARVPPPTVVDESRPG